MWLRQYLYIPLGGSRISPVRTYMNLMTVMILCGLWHGAAPSSAVWGFAHGALLSIERYGAQIMERYAPGYQFNSVAKIAYSALVFVCVSLSWLLFRFEDFSQASAYFLSILHNPLHFTMPNIWYGFAFLYMLPVLVQHALVGRVIFTSGNKVLTGVFFGLLLWLALAERGADTPFIYFRF